MKCKTIRNDIFLYHELSVLDRSSVDAHIQACIQCRRIFDEMEESRVIIAEASSFLPHEHHASKLTGRIMNAVVAQQRRRPTFAVTWLDNRILRLAMSLASFVLIVAFVMQFESPPVTNKLTHSTNWVSLHTTNQMRDLRAQLTKSQKSPSLYACLHQEDCALTILERIKTRSYK